MKRVLFHRSLAGSRIVKGFVLCSCWLAFAPHGLDDLGKPVEAALSHPWRGRSRPIFLSKGQRLRFLGSSGVHRGLFPLDDHAILTS